jgi:DNA polymerase I
MILVDGNSLGFAATAAHDLHAGTVQTGGVWGFLGYLRDIRETFGGKMYVLWDGHSWRYEESPEYKGTRTTNPKLVEIKERWKPQRKLVAKMLATIGVSQLQSMNMEADDLAGRTCEKQAGRDIALISGDKDWCQLVNEHVTWVDPIRRRRATPSNLKEIVGYDTAWQFIQAKALTGDKSDNIHPVGGLGDKAAEFIFERFGSVQGMLNEAALSREAFNSLPKKYQSFVDDPQKIDSYHRNLRLVWLNHPNLPAAQKPLAIKSTFNRERFCDLCGELAFTQILRDADAWAAPFLALDHGRIAA